LFIGLYNYKNWFDTIVGPVKNFLKMGVHNPIQTVSLYDEIQ